MFPSKKQKIFSLCVFTVYFILLTWLILFKLTTDFSTIPSVRSLNLIPFGASSVDINQSVGLREIVYNMLVFVPFGVYIVIFMPRMALWKKIGTGLLLSAAYECIQFIFAIGRSDITDTLMNTLGCVVGIVIAVLLDRLLKKKFVPFVNTVGAIIGGGALLLMILLTIAN